MKFSIHRFIIIDSFRYWSEEGSIDNVIVKYEGVHSNLAMNVEFEMNKL